MFYYSWFLLLFLLLSIFTAYHFFLTNRENNNGFETIVICVHEVHHRMCNGININSMTIFVLFCVLKKTHTKSFSLERN